VADDRDELAQELAELAGPQAGTWAGKVDTASKVFVTRGTKAGARLGSRFTKVVDAREEVELDATPEEARRRVEQALAELGSPRGEELSAVVPSGFGNMNPAIVRASVAESGAGSRVVIEAAALEGLVKQRAAAKAAKRVADRLVEG
jgi:hypothetical protein